MLNYLFIRKLYCWKRAGIFFHSLVVFFCFLASARFEEGHFVFVWDRALVIFSFFFFFFASLLLRRIIFRKCLSSQGWNVRQKKSKAQVAPLDVVRNHPQHPLACQTKLRNVSLPWQKEGVSQFLSVYIRWCKNVVVIFWCSLDTACNCTAILMQGLVPLTDTCPTLALQRAADFSPLLCFYIQRRFVFCTLGTALPCFNLWFPLDFVCT